MGDTGGAAFAPRPIPPRRRLNSYCFYCMNDIPWTRLLSVRGLAIVWIVGLSMGASSCTSPPRDVASAVVAVAPGALNVKAGFVLDHAMVRHRITNNEAERWILIDDLLGGQVDGFSCGERLRFVAGDFRGISHRGDDLGILVGPGQTVLRTMDLRKNYLNLDLSRTKPPKSFNLWVSTFETKADADRFVEYLASKDLFELQRLEKWWDPRRTQIVAPWSTSR